MKFTTASIVAVVAAGLASAHMEMVDPPPFRSKHNQNVQNADYSYTSPLGIFPCKGFHSDLGTAAGASVATWAAGSQQKFTIGGGAPHNGGSCQAALSYDKGATFKVIHSYIGNCPVNGESSYSFTVPSSAPGGEAIFAWTWFNNVGNREMYMNCAAVTVTGGGGDISSLPDLFVANVAAAPDCKTTEGSDVMFPDPGANVDNNSSKTGPPVGNCGAVAGTPAPGGDDGDDADDADDDDDADDGDDSPAPPKAPTQSQAPAQTQAPKAQPPAQATTTRVPGGAFLPTETSTSSTLATVTRRPTSATTSTPASASPSQTSRPLPNVPQNGAQNGACTVEGVWICLGGSSFQRCASGLWSPVQAMAQGTTCQSGVSSALTWGKKRAVRGVNRFAPLA